MSIINGLADSSLGSGMDHLAGALANPKPPAEPSPVRGTPDQVHGRPTINVDGSDQMTPDQGQFHPMADASHPFWSSLASMVAPQGGAAPPAMAPPAQAIPVQQPMGVMPQQQMGMQGGGVVVPSPAFMHGPAIPVGPNSGIVPASTEGQILTMDAGGAVPDAFVNPMGGPTPPVTGRAAGIAQGLAQGQVMGRNLRNAWDRHQARKDAGDYGANLVGIDAEHPENQQPEPSMIDKAKDAVEGFFHHLHQGTLNDNHVANSAVGVPADPAAADNQSSPTSGDPQQAIPTTPPAGAPSPAPAPTPPAAAPQGAPAPPPGAAPAQAPAAALTPQGIATATAVKDAASDPAANSGVPQQSPAQSGKPHSLDTDYWHESQIRLQKAVRSAAMAGEDPEKVYQSLTAMRNAHFQGQILRQLSAANTALLNGDESSVRQALSNVNYYLPNGKGVDFRNAKAADVAADKTGQTQVGQLMYRNPMAGLYGHQGEPDYISVTPQHIQLLGTAALDPMNVQNTILKTYSAQAEAQKNMLQAQGEYNTGLGRLQWGNALQTRAQLESNMQPVEKYLKYATGMKNEAEAGYYGRKQDKTGGALGPKVTMGSIQSAQKAAQQAVDNFVQGQFTTAPVQDAQGNPNLSPAAGRPVHDPSRIPTIFRGMTPDQQQKASSLAAAIGGANVGIHDAGTSADLAARIVRYEGAKTPTTHIDPATHNVVKDIVYDQKQNTIHVWVGNGWKNAYIRPNIIDDDNRSPIPSDSGAGGEPSGAEDSSGMENN